MTVEGAVKSSALDLFIAALGERATKRAGNIAREIRQSGCSVEVAPDGKLKRAMELANKLGARYALIIGEDEIASGRYALKNMASGEQVQIARDQIAQRLRATN